MSKLQIILPGADDYTVQEAASNLRTIADRIESAADSVYDNLAEVVGAMPEGSSGRQVVAFPAMLVGEFSIIEDEERP